MLSLDASDDLFNQTTTIDDDEATSDDEDKPVIDLDGLVKLTGDSKESDQAKLFENMFAGMMKATRPVATHQLPIGPRSVDYKGFSEKQQDSFDHYGNPIVVKTLIIKSKHILKVLRSILPCVQTFFGDSASFSPPSTIMLYYYELLEWEERYRRFMAQNDLTEEDLKHDDSTDGDQAINPRTGQRNPKRSHRIIPRQASGGYVDEWDACNESGFANLGKLIEEEEMSETDSPFSMESVKEEFDDLIKYLQTNYRSSINGFIKMVKAGVIDSSNLGRLLKVGDKYLFEDIDTHIVGVLNSKNFDGYNWSFGYKMIRYDHTKKRFSETQSYCTIPDFIGTLQIDSMTFKPYNEAHRATYTQRGAKYCKLVKDISHLSHSGFMYRIVRHHEIALMKLRNNGRVVIDDSNGTKYETQHNSHRGGEQNLLEEVPDDKLDMCYPYLYGHSLTNKEWGSFLITELTDIVYRDDAFDLLRLDTPIDVPTPDGGYVKIMKKELIRKMVLNQKNIKFQDLVDGKSSGLIILLYGPPGVGKTLTAEVTAEVLHLPLRKLSMGELGTSVHDIEDKLTEVLDNVRRWGAVLLIDEVDILLEKRTEKTDIEKNAIVGVFLRELEYHDGIVFLTSNRFEVMDPAVDSRIHLKIGYNDLSREDKIAIFSSNLRRLHTEPVMKRVETLVDKYPEFNGRNLKNILMMSQCLAHPDPVTHDHIDATVQVITSYHNKVGGGK